MDLRRSSSSEGREPEPNELSKVRDFSQRKRAVKKRFDLAQSGADLEKALLRREPERLQSSKKMATSTEDLDRTSATGRDCS